MQEQDEKKGDEPSAWEALVYGVVLAIAVTTVLRNFEWMFE